MKKNAISLSIFSIMLVLSNFNYATGHKHAATTMPYETILMNLDFTAPMTKDNEIIRQNFKDGYYATYTPQKNNKTIQKIYGPQHVLLVERVLDEAGESKLTTYFLYDGQGNKTEEFTLNADNFEIESKRWTQDGECHITEFYLIANTQTQSYYNDKNQIYEKLMANHNTGIAEYIEYDTNTGAIIETTSQSIQRKK